MDVSPTSDASTMTRHQVGAGRDLISETGESRGSFLGSFGYWVPPALLALGLTWIYLNPFIGDWDGLDYTVYSISGEPSSMALGRSLFTFFNHYLYLGAHGLFGLRPEHAYLLFKYAVVAQSPLAVIVCWVLARDLSGSKKSATIAAMLVACSPMFVIYSGQVMTEVPSVLVSATALLVYLRGVQRRRLWLMLLGGALLGLGVNLRETVGLYLPWLILSPFIAGWKFNRRTLSAIAASAGFFFFFAFVPFVLWFKTHPEYQGKWHTWLSTMQEESARHPIGVASLRPFFVFFFLCAPLIFVALPVAAWKEWRARGLSLLLTAGAIGLLATAMLFFNYSTTINWRYFLTGLPFLAPLVGDYFVRSQTERLKNARLGFVTAIAGVILVAGLMGLLIRPASSDYFNHLAMARTYNERLRLMPRDAVVIAGAETVAVNYWRGIGEGEWIAIGIGAGWPSNGLQNEINRHFKDGRRIFLDDDPRWWQPCNWHLTEIAELAGIEKHFHFRQVAPTVFEIRPVDDPSATDQPHLEKLLPENRPDEVKNCFNPG